MIDDRTESLSLDEAIAQQEEARVRRRIRRVRVVALGALTVGLGLVPTGRSWVLHSIGYVVVALVATSAMAYATRKSALLQHVEAPVRVRGVIVFNVLCSLVALVHMVYVARRIV